MLRALFLVGEAGKGAAFLLPREVFTASWYPFLLPFQFPSLPRKYKASLSHRAPRGDPRVLSICMGFLCRNFKKGESTVPGLADPEVPGHPPKKPHPVGSSQPGPWGGASPV